MADINELEITTQKPRTVHRQGNVKSMLPYYKPTSGYDWLSY